MSFGGSSSKARGDKRARGQDTGETDRGNKQTKKKKKTRRRAYFFYNSTGFLYYKFFLTDWIATESKALHGELSATRRTQHRHERGREEAFRQKVSNLKSL